MKSGDHTCATIQSGGSIQSGGQDERPNKVMTTERWREGVKSLMNCFNETRNHGSGDQDFDGIIRSDDSFA